MTPITSGVILVMCSLLSLNWHVSEQLHV